MDSKNDGSVSAGKRERNQNIQVYVRIRPMPNSGSVIDTPGTREVVVRERTVANITKTFTFDKVFDAVSTQQDVYRTVVSPLLKEVLLGYNCTVFAYGQTGTGKTYTMEGDLGEKKGSNMSLAGLPSCESVHAGILPRALSQLFDEVRAMNCEFQVRVSFLELYNEELFDLLANDPAQTKKTLRIYEDANRKGSVVIQGLEEVIVQTKQEVYDVVARGSQQRRTAATWMNDSSSRSHSVFTITVHMRESTVDGEEMVKVGKLYLVDLAGSENIGKSGAVDKRAREAGSINQSLLTLGRVISALVERTPHVPYRESKLTRLLQDSLGGKTKTSIIATVSPSPSNIEETLSTLDYAHRAKNIMNKPEVNQRMTKREALSIYTEEIERLRKDLMAARSGVGFFIDQNNYDSLQSQITSLNLELVEKSNHVQSLKGTVEAKDKEIEVEVMKQMEMRQDLDLKDTMLANANNRISYLQKRLIETLTHSDELQHLLNAQVETEKKLQCEAGSLLQTTNETVSTIETLYSRLDRKQKVEDANLKHTKRFRSDLDNMVTTADSTLNQIKERNVLATLDFFHELDEHKNSRGKMIDACQAAVKNSFTAFLTINSAMADNLEKLKKNISAATASSNLFFTGSVENGVKDSKHMKDSLTEMTQTMKTQLASMKTEVNKLKTSIENEFTKLEERVKSVLLNDAKEFVRMEKVMLTLKSNYKKLSDEFESSSQDFELRETKYTEKYKQMIAQMKQTVEAFETETGKHMEGSAQSRKDFSHKFTVSTIDGNTLLSDELKMVQTSKAIPEKVANDFTKFRERNVTAHHNRLKNLYENMDERIHSAQQVENKVNSVILAHANTLNQHLTTTSTHNEQIETEVKRYIANAPFEALKLRYEKSRAGVADMITNVDKTENLFLQQIQDSSNKRLEEMSKGFELASTDIRKISGYQNEFWDLNYLMDLPTGATPMKREYKYPTKFSATSPHDRVIQRYRSVSRKVVDTLLECETTGTDICPSDSEDEGKLSEEERERKKREAELFKQEDMETQKQREQWDKEEQNRTRMNKMAKAKLEKGTPLTDLLQELGRAKSRAEIDLEKSKDEERDAQPVSGNEEEGIQICRVPPRPANPLPEEKENDMPAVAPAPSSKSRKKSGGNKKKARK